MAESDAAPAPEKAKVLVKPLSMVLGAVSGLGIAVLLQGYAVAPLTWGLLAVTAIGGALVFGIALPTLMLRIYMAKDETPVQEASP